MISSRFQAAINTHQKFIAAIPTIFRQMNKRNSTDSVFNPAQQAKLNQLGVVIQDPIDIFDGSRLLERDPVRGTAHYQEEARYHDQKTKNDVNYDTNKQYILTFWLPKLTQILANVDTRIPANSYYELLALQRILTICGELMYGCPNIPHDSFAYRCIGFRHASAHDYAMDPQTIIYLSREAAHIRDVNDLAPSNQAAQCRH